jgi:hypothetical protein
MTRVSSVRIDLDRAGIRSLLGDDGVQAMLMRKAGAVATAANEHSPMVDGIPGDEKPPIYQVDARSSSRARALVVLDHPAGLAIEAKHRLLVGSLDAARS